MENPAIPPGLSVAKKLLPHNPDSSARLCYQLYKSQGTDRDKNTTGQVLLWLAKALEKQCLYDSALKYSMMARGHIEKNSLQEADLQNTMGNIYTAWGDFPMARSFYEVSLQLRVKHDDTAAIAASNYNLGVVHDRLGKYDSAVYYLYQAALYDSLANNLTGRGFDLVKSSQVNNRQGHYLSARVGFEKARKIFSRTGSRYGLANAIQGIGDSWYYRGHYDSALGHYQQALELHAEINNPEGKAIGLQSLGVTYKNLGHHEQALKRYLGAMDIFEQTGNNLGMAAIYSNLGSLYHEWEKLGLARAYYQKALAMYKQLGAKQEIANTLARVGTVWLQEGKLDTAEVYFTKALALQEELGNHAEIASILRNRCDIHVQQEEYTKALDNQVRATGILEKLASDRLLAEAYVQLANLYLDLGKQGMAKKSFVKAKGRANIIHSPRVHMQLYHGLSRLYQQTGHYQNALHYKWLHDQVKDSLFTAEKHQQIQELRVRYETEKKDQEIELLKTRQSLQSAELKMQRKNILYMTSGISALVFFLVLLGIQYYKKNKAYHDLVGKNLELVKVQAEKRASPKKKGNPLLPDKQSEKLKTRLVQLMEIEKLFTHPDLNILSMAKQLGTNQRYLTDIVNRGFHKSFPVFVNEYRVKEAQQIMSGPLARDYSLEGIAQQVGFNNRATFISAFKKYTGVTPSYYLKESKKIQGEV
jgi:tetratricopeptide (TPR) repeat protein/AraC-like DNA-binding protein